MTLQRACSRYGISSRPAKQLVVGWRKGERPREREGERKREIDEVSDD